MLSRDVFMKVKMKLWKGEIRMLLCTVKEEVKEEVNEYKCQTFVA